MVTPAEAALELQQRRRARSNLLDFTTYTKPDYQTSWHHEVTAYWLDKWANKEIKRLILCQPPRNGKSELASRRLPAYLLGKNPNTQIIATSYSADLASRMNRDVQRIILTDEYKRLFPKTRLNDRNVRSTAEENYQRNSDIFEVVGFRGSYRSAGRGGGVTGMGADYIIVDDPIKDKEEAMSETVRQSTEDWYNATLHTRQQKDCCILVIMTRWHTDDLVGRLLDKAKNDPNADQWTVIVLPAIADHSLVQSVYGDKVAELARTYDKREDGELLWPSMFDAKFLAASKATLVEDFACLQQQSPLPAEGRKFQREWFKIVDSVPLEAMRVRYWDKAGTADGGAFTVGVLMAFDGYNYFIEDVIRVQLEYGPREKLIRQTAQLDHDRYAHVFIGEGIESMTVWLEQEPGSGGKESASRSVINLSGFNVYTERVSGDKEVRAGPYAAQASAGNVCLLRGDWNAKYLEELSTFPRGKYKDQVDASSGAFNKLSLGWPIEETIVSVERVSISDY